MDQSSKRIIVIVFGVISAVVPMIGSLWHNYNYFFCDTAYYCSIIERIAEGYVPYKSVSCGYTPLFFYICAGLKLLFNIPYGCYKFYLAIIYLFQIGSAFFLYKLSYKFCRNFYLSFITAWLFLIISHWNDGNAVLLENPSVFFGLGSLLLCLNPIKKENLNFFLAGFLSCCAFLCKQFGVGFICLDLFIIIFGKNIKQKTSKCSLFMLGVLLPVTICIIIWGEELIPLVNSGYGISLPAEAGEDVSFSSKGIKIIYRIIYFCIRVVPFCIFSLLLTPKDKSKLFLFVICWLGILGFSFQYYFNAGSLHYSLFMIPFALLLIPASFSEAKKIGITAKVFYSGILLTMIISFSSTYYKRVYLEYVCRSQKQWVQLMDDKLKDEIQNIIPKDETIWVHGVNTYYIYYLTNRLPPNLCTIGYSFGPLGLSKQEALAQAKSADWIIWDGEINSKYMSKELMDIYENNPYLCLESYPNIRLFKRDKR